ncbi:MAG: ferrochelatase, partial [Bacteriovoracaceae bacterium]
ARSGRLYARIWDGESFPLITITRDFAQKVQQNLDPELVEVNHAFLLTPPKVSDVWDSWEEDIKTGNDPATSLLVIPMFPQYSESTIASGADGFFSVLKNRVQLPPFEFMTNFHRAKCFVDNSVRQIEDFLARFEREDGGADALLISFHGIPKRRVLVKNDAYYQHCFETYHLMTTRVKGVAPENMRMSFQSRFGSEEWLTPYTEDVVEELIAQGKKKIAVYCPSFVADCLETIDEIGTELKEEAHEHGGEILFIPCLIDQDEWCRDFAKFVENHVEADASTKAQDYYTLDDEDYKYMSTPEFKESEPLSPEAKSSIKIIFLTLFLDLVGFSIIFPLFPALAEHYLAVDGDNFFLRLIFDGVRALMATSEGAGAFSSVVLFGGALGAIYSFLQFIAAPLWGGLSDRIGRRPVLLISVAGLALSYLLWFFSGSFTLLILARFVGGIMGGNISTATAVIADVTSQKIRSKGMAFV